MVAVLLLLIGGGCASPAQQSIRPAPSSAASSAVVETPTGTCTTVTQDQGLLLYDGWVDVVASKGSSGHQRQVERFAEESGTLNDARGEDACPDVAAMVAQLSSEAARLVSWMLIGEGKAELSKYQAVADAGNTLMSQLGVDKRFDTPSLTGP